MQLLSAFPLKILPDPIIAFSSIIELSRIIASVAIHTLFFIHMGLVLYSNISDLVLCVHEIIFAKQEIDTSFSIMTFPLPSTKHEWFIILLSPNSIFCRAIPMVYKPILAPFLFSFQILHKTFF